MTSDNPQSAPADAIRALGEESRSPEFKERRDTLLLSVDDLVGKVQASATSGEPLPSGIEVKQGLGIQRDVVPIPGAWNMSVAAVRTGDVGVYCGVSNFHGREVPVIQVIEKLVVGPGKISHKIWEIEGSNPIDRAEYGPEAGFASSGNARQLGLVRFAEDDHYVEFAVNGDGAVKRTARNEGGVHEGVSIRNAGELAEPELILSELAISLLEPPESA
ncbi:MAG TPA: hypothetical protein PKA02_04075 [Candidatus Saccharibacteria bacterium]|nr:hypothetical protein [Candidatus Saccharibacteria bacterium]